MHSETKEKNLSRHDTFLSFVQLVLGAAFDASL